jgi:phage tail tape-measure protein
MPQVGPGSSAACSTAATLHASGPELSSAAGGVLSKAGRSNKLLDTVAPDLPPFVGPSVTFTQNAINGTPVVENVAQTTGDAAGSAAGAWLGGVACGPAETATLGGATPICIGFIGAGSAVGGAIGQTIGGWIANHLGKNDGRAPPA